MLLAVYPPGMTGAAVSREHKRAPMVQARWRHGGAGIKIFEALDVVPDVTKKTRSLAYEAFCANLGSIACSILEAESLARLRASQPSA